MDIRLDEISHSYGDTEVLRDISLDIPDGKIVCLVGPSGCGKSTLLRLIGGLERPSKGRVLQLGSPPEGCLNPLTYVFQDLRCCHGGPFRGIYRSFLRITGLKGRKRMRSSRTFLRAPN